MHECNFSKINRRSNGLRVMFGQVEKKGWGHWSHHVYFFTDGTEERFSVTLPSVITAETTDTTMTLLMSSSKLESASAYMIAVKELNSLQRQRRQVTLDVKKNLWSYENAVKRGIKQYICAKFWSTLPDRFVVGDGETYNNFLNPPLTSGKTYSIAFIVTTSFGKIIYRELGNAVVLKAHEHAFSAVKTPEVLALSAYGIVATALTAVFFVTVVILIAVLIFIYKKRRNIDRSIDKRNGLLAMQPLDNTSVDDGFQNSAFSDVADERSGQELSGHYMVPDIQRTHSVIADNSRVSHYSAPYLHISSSRQSMIDPLDHHLDLDRHLDLDHPHYESPEILSTMTHTVENNYENNTSSVPRTRVNRLYSRPGISPEVNPPSDVSDRDINPYAISAHRRLSYDSNYEDLRLS